MELIRHLYNFRDRHRDCVATIGNFDGVHLGHQAIIGQLKMIGQKYKLPTVILTFEPHPQEFFSPDKAPARVMRLREKLAYFRETGIDRVVCLRFDRKLAELSADDFVNQILIDRMNIRHLIIGDDFRFGKERRGDISTLREHAQRAGFEVDHTDTCEIENRRVSSTWLREVLAQGDMDTAAVLLGRPYSVSGRIVHGEKRGKELGYPTININLHRHRSPVTGIFAARVHGLDTTPIEAAVSIGTRPVFNGETINLEAHLLDFDRDVYGAYVTVELVKHLRSEQMFGNISDLKKQIEKDIAETRQFFCKK